MKNQLLVASAILISSFGFAQKAEIKAAEKALKSGNSEAAKSAIESASALIANADDKYKAQYHFVRGNVYYDLAKKGLNEDMSFKEAIKSYNDLVSFEETAKKKKYSTLAKQSLTAITGDIVNSAIKDNTDKKFKSAAAKLYTSYNLSKKDTVYLYYAANSAVQGGHHEDALKYYEELKTLNYDGSELKYYATNVESGKVEAMEKTQRDLMVKSKTYKDPKDEKTKSKRAEIVKNLAFIYTQLGQNDKALAAYADARKNTPNDVNLILNEANLHLTIGNKDKFKTLMKEAADVDPNNPDLHYNIGVINMEQKNFEEARVAYKKALEINPAYVNALMNLSTTYINEGNGLIDEMNSLGNSRKDIARYDELKQQKDDMFVVGAKILEDGLKLNVDNQGILGQLKNIYGALGDNDNYMRIKGLIKE